MVSTTAKRDSLDLKYGHRYDEENRPPVPLRRDPSSGKAIRYPPSEKRDSLDLAIKHHESGLQANDSRSDDEENRTPPSDRPDPPFQQRVHNSSLKYERSKETVMAYMIPLPRPVRDGVPQNHVPQRYMLYMPPSPDLLKIPQEGGKERKRDKAVRLWQQEVRKAKTYNGSLVTFRGIESASIRGAVWALNFVKPSDVTFLSRIPRKSIRSLNLVHPEPQHHEVEVRVNDNESLARTNSKIEEDSLEEMYDGVKEELTRSKKRTRRDFFIGTALLPVTTAIDFVIPVFGGLSEVTLVWMVLNATGWATANRIAGRLVLGGSNNTKRQQQQQQQQQQQDDSEDDDIYTAEGSHQQNAGHNAAHGREGEEDPGTGTARWGSRTMRQGKSSKSTIEMTFNPCPAMSVMAQYVQAACHRHNADIFVQPAYSPGEAEVLTSIGWTPERRGGEEISEEDDIAWQIRQVTEDIRVSTDRAAKSWSKWCKKHMKKRTHTAKEPDGEEER